MSSDTSLYLSAGFTTGTFISSSFLANLAVEKARTGRAVLDSVRAAIRRVMMRIDTERDYSLALLVFTNRGERCDLGSAQSRDNFYPPKSQILVLHSKERAFPAVSGSACLEVDSSFLFLLE